MSAFASCLVALALAQADAEKAEPADAAPTATPAPASRATPAPAPAPAPAEAPPSTGAPRLEPAAAATVRPKRAAPARPSPTPIATPTAPSPQPEREQALRAARTFLDALAASDADALAQAASDRFSFDGDSLSGRDAVRRRWRELLADRPGPAPRVNAVDLLSAQDAVARFGKPPARVAALARPGVWVAVGDVGGRSVVLFVAREGGRLAVLGIHD